MQLISTIFVASVLFVNSVSAQSTVGPSGTSAASVETPHSTLTPLGPILPDFSVLPGGSTSVPTASGVPDVSVLGDSTTTADAVYGSQTICYEYATIGVTTETSTINNGVVPTGGQCYQVFSTGGGVVWLPLSNQSSTSSTNKAISISLPIVISFVVLALIIAGGFIFMRFRKRRLAKPNRAWLNRPGGWAQDGHITERGITAKD
jgi:hypothetical protein